MIVFRLASARTDVVPESIAHVAGVLKGSGPGKKKKNSVRIGAAIRMYWLPSH
jgi:hypothetical protein